MVRLTLIVGIRIWVEIWARVRVWVRLDSYSYSNIKDCPHQEGWYGVKSWGYRTILRVVVWFRGVGFGVDTGVAFGVDKRTCGFRGGGNARLITQTHQRLRLIVLLGLGARRAVKTAPSALEERDALTTECVITRLFASIKT